MKSRGLGDSVEKFTKRQQGSLVDVVKDVIV